MVITVQDLNEELTKLIYKRHKILNLLNTSIERRVCLYKIKKQIRLLNKNKRKIDALIDKMYQISITAEELSIEDIVEF